MAASSSSSNSNIGWTYDVFLSFAGKDTRKGFVAHIYRALDDRGFYVFHDEYKLHMGDSISKELLKAIEESRIAVVVFSEKYGASSWCLDELVKIMECKKLMGQTVIPVFYDIDPFIIRRQRGVFEVPFQKHEIRYENDLDKVQSWRDALAEAASLSGCDVSNTSNGNESECILKIVQEISSKCPTISVEKNLVGIESRVRKMKSLLVTTSDDVRFIGIWGMGGAGKTTLARAVFNEISNQFQSRCYVSNVREVSKRSGLSALQEKILSEILLDRSLKINDDHEIHDGTKLIATRLRRKRVLLVLDDVDEDGQLDALAGSHEWFGMGSIIIITTRDKCRLKMPKVEIQTVTLLNHSEAIRLFSLYAFENSSPPNEYKEHLDCVVHYADGLPLALKVMGSSLRGCVMDEWRSAINRLHEAGEDKIFEILKISYDGLSKIDQKIFLDIACFFKGKKKDRVTRILDSFDFHAHIGIKHLIQKSLVSVLNKKLHMHDRIQEMGWHIVCNISDEPGKRSRLWLPKDVRDVLTNNMGNNAIEGISLVSTELEAINFSKNAFKNMNGLRLLHFDNGRVLPGLKFLPNKLRWLSPGPLKYLPSKLQSFSQGPNYLPNKLRWITWNAYPSDSLPESFQAEELVGLEMCRSNIVQLWKGKKNLDKLRFVNLSWSCKLKGIPDLKLTPNLETLILESCTSLVDIHPSIGDLERLVFLSLKGCLNLKSLPSCIQMKSLKTFILSNCVKLKRFPEITKRMDSLSRLYLDGTSIEELPSSIQNLAGLVLINLENCRQITSLPSTIHRLNCLKTLVLTNCTRLEKLPDNLGHVQSLEELFLDNAAIREPPSSIVHLTNLKTLSIGGCRALLSWLLLKSSPDSMPPLVSFCSVRKLNVSSCNLSERAIPNDLSPLTFLEELDLSKNSFHHLPDSICQLPRLRILNVSWCHTFKALQALPSGIAVLQADEGQSLESFPDLSTKYPSLWKLSFVYTITGFIPTGNNDPANVVLQSLLQGHLVANHRFSIVVPGINIPEWFSQQNSGCHAYLRLPLNWCNRNFLGFAFCVVFDNTVGDSVSYANIQFDLIADSNTQFFTPPATSSIWYETEHVWLGFMSFDFFQLLFPDLQPDDWSGIEGYLHVGFSHERISCDPQKCAVRLVYKEDMKRVPVPAIQNSGVLNNPMGEPWSQHDLNGDDNDDQEENDTYSQSISKISPNMAYLKETGYRRAQICLDI